MEKRLIDNDLKWGKAIAARYIAAQGKSIEDSNAACDLITKANIFAKQGFDLAIREDGRYNVTALGSW